MKIFISYRRADSSDMSRKIYDALAKKFGKENIFRDVDSLLKGKDFRAGIEKFITACDVMLVLIGENWLNQTETDGSRRLDNPQDFVRIEVELGLRHVPTVIPVLLGDAKMPDVSQLPHTLTQLAFQNAAQLANEKAIPNWLIDFKSPVPSQQSKQDLFITPVTQAYMDLCHFSKEDLIANRAGHLSQKQEKKYRIRIVFNQFLNSLFYSSLVSLILIVIAIYLGFLNLTDFPIILLCFSIFIIAVMLFDNFIIARYRKSDFYEKDIKESIGFMMVTTERKERYNGYKKRYDYNYIIYSYLIQCSQSHLQFHVQKGLNYLFVVDNLNLTKIPIKVYYLPTKLPILLSVEEARNKN